MTLTERIVVDPTILTGKPVVRGTRIPGRAGGGVARGRLEPRADPGELSAPRL